MGALTIIQSSTFPVAIPEIGGSGFWAPEPVFPLDEAARLLGTTKHNLRVNVRRRHPEVRLPKGVLNLSTPFGPSLTEFGEVTVAIDTPGGPQEHICLTHFGLFRHAIYIRTEKARRYALAYPEFACALTAGTLRKPSQVAPLWRAVLDAPRGSRVNSVRALAGSLGRSEAFVWSGLHKIRIGMVTREGLPARKNRSLRRYSNEVFLIRQSTGESYQTLAKRLGVNKSTIRKWERGVHGPLPKNLAALRLT